MKLHELKDQNPPKHIFDGLTYHTLSRDDDKLKELYQELSSNTDKKLIEKINEHTALYTLDGRYFCLSDTHKRMTCFVGFSVSNDKTIGTFIYDILIWRYWGSSSVESFPQKILFKNILPIYKTIVLDAIKEWDATRYWYILIGAAFKANFNIYFYDFTSKKKEQINTYSDMDKFENDFEMWKHRADIKHTQRFIISV